METEQDEVEHLAEYFRVPAQTKPHHKDSAAPAAKYAKSMPKPLINSWYIYLFPQVSRFPAIWARSEDSIPQEFLLRECFPAQAGRARS